MTVTVYFGTLDGMLEAEERTIYRSVERVNQIKQVLLELIAGPAYPQHIPVLPEVVELREVYSDGHGVAYLDFSRALAGPVGTTGELLRVYAVVNTMLKNFEEFKGIQLLVEGEERESLAGHIDIRRPCVSDPSLIVRSRAAPLP